MNRKALRQVKQDGGKRLESCEFARIRKGKLPKPLDKLGSRRIKASPLYDIGMGYKAVFVWKTGQILEQRALFGWLLQEVPKGLLPLARLDYHLSHKNLHIKTNCESNRDLTNRDLPGCKEFNLNSVNLDPDQDNDRKRFISIFCERLNIELGLPGLL